MLIYLHGFNSSPQSHKAELLGRYLTQHGLGGCYACPALPHQPEQAVALIETELARAPKGPLTLVGSSLGGFYATWFAEKHGLKAVLINPAVHPHRDLRIFLGVQQNLHSGEKYELTEAHLAQWARLFVPVITPTRYLLLVETGDEVLDYREAVGKYAGAKQVVVQGGDHSLRSFPHHIPLVLEFADLTRDAPGHSV
ncbi:MAG: esterase [Betaproteobacteria bacterium RBG_16_64_9]|nr:MAG: esterase [Betaproteobacteria bacterium RBG_16_64_9]